MSFDTDFASESKARFLQQLNELIQQKQRIQSDTRLKWEDQNNQIRNLCIPLAQAQLPVRLDDLGLTFQYYPPSRVFGYSAVDLKPNGELEDVTIDNVEEYVELMTDFILHTGIRKQMEAFKGLSNLTLDSCLYPQFLFRGSQPSLSYFQTEFLYSRRDASYALRRTVTELDPRRHNQIH